MTATIVAKNTHDIETALKRLENHDSYTLAFVFTDYRMDMQPIADVFKKSGISVFGTSTESGIVDGEIYNESIVAYLFDFPKDSFFSGLYSLDDTQDSKELARRFGKDIKKRFKNSAAIVGWCGVYITGDDFLSELHRSTDGNTPVFGGIAAGEFDFATTHVFSEDRVTNKAVITIVFDTDKIEVTGRVISCWKRIGTHKMITKSDGTNVYEIDGQPALDVYDRYFNIGKTEEDLLSAIEYPIQMQRPDGTYVTRVAALPNLADRSISYGGGVPEGSKVWFCSPNIHETLRETDKQLNNFQSQIDSCDAVVLFSCIARKYSFKSHILSEIQTIYKVFNAPVAGYFSFGEIGNVAGGVCDFHNTSLSIVCLNDKTKTKKPKYEKNILNIDGLQVIETQNPQTQQLIDDLIQEKLVLSNFLHRISEDLDRANKIIEEERAKSETLLLNILPAPIAERLKRNEKVIADGFDNVTVLFADMVGFTKYSSGTKPDDVVAMLNEIFSIFDILCVKLGLEKIKTIGDAYMIAGGLPIPSEDHAARMADMALDMIDSIRDFPDFNLRIGINSGPVVAGVIGTHKFVYDLWGDTVNIASRMESHGMSGRIQISESTNRLIKDKFATEERGEIEVKGKGLLKTYWLLSRKSV